jgi:hypothetical protein
MKGGKQPPRGRKLPDGEDPRDRKMRHAAELGAALHRGMTSRRIRAKTVMQWTDAGERTVKAWRGGTSIPRGDHLIELMRHSDEVFATVLRLSRRSDGGMTDLMDWRDRLAAIVVSMDHAWEMRRRDEAPGGSGAN